MSPVLCPVVEVTRFWDAPPHGGAVVFKLDITRGVEPRLEHLHHLTSVLNTDGVVNIWLPVWRTVVSCRCGWTAGVNGSVNSKRLADDKMTQWPKYYRCSEAVLCVFLPYLPGLDTLSSIHHGIEAATHNRKYFSLSFRWGAHCFTDPFNTTLLHVLNTLSHTKHWYIIFTIILLLRLYY